MPSNALILIVSPIVGLASFMAAHNFAVLPEELATEIAVGAAVASVLALLVWNFFSRPVQKKKKKKSKKKKKKSQSNESKPKAKQPEVKSKTKGKPAKAKAKPKKKTSVAKPNKKPLQESSESSDEADFDFKPRKAQIQKKSQQKNKPKPVPRSILADGFEFQTTAKQRRQKVKRLEQRAYGKNASKKQEQVTSTETRSEIQIDPKFYGLIIGPQGTTLKKLTEGSKTNIDIPDRESGSSKIVIRGERGGVDLAKSAIKCLITKGFSSLTHENMSSSELTIIDPKSIGIIIGPNGKNIKAIQETTNTKVVLPDRNGYSKKVQISGAKADVKVAKEAIKSLIAHGFSSITHPAWILVEVAFPLNFRHLIGPKGQTIRSIQGDTRTKINIPDKNNSNQNVTVVGPEDGVMRAKKQIEKLIMRHEEEKKETPEQQDYDYYDEEDNDDYDQDMSEYYYNR